MAATGGRRRLKAIARTPELPTLKPAQARQAAPSVRVPDIWLGASIRAIEGEEFSAFGVSRESGGFHLTKVPPSSLAAKAGLPGWGSASDSVHNYEFKTFQQLT